MKHKNIFLTLFLCTAYAGIAFVLYKYAEPEYAVKTEALLPLGTAALCILMTELFDGTPLPPIFTAAALIANGVFFFRSVFLFFPAAELYVFYKNIYCRNRSRKISFYAAGGLCAGSAVCFLIGFFKDNVQPLEFFTKTEWLARGLFFILPLFFLLLFFKSFSAAKKTAKAEKKKPKVKNEIPETYHTFYLLCFLFATLQAVYFLFYTFGTAAGAGMLPWLLLIAALYVNSDPALAFITGRYDFFV